MADAGDNKNSDDDNKLDEILKKIKKGNGKFPFIYLLGVVVAILTINTYFSTTSSGTIPLSDFKARISSGEIKYVKMVDGVYEGYMSDPSLSELGQGAIYKSNPLPRFTDQGFSTLLEKSGATYEVVPEDNNPLVAMLLQWVIPLGLMFIIWRFMFKKIGGMGGSNVMNFGQNKSKILTETNTGVLFNDVAGCEEAKYELEEVVDFLKNSKKYTEIGGKIPKGVLLVGPPGTGKTLMAKAVAGEAGVTFFRLSGADFVEMFVGVGAARVRDLFKQAREKSPSIIFIDELDAIGKSRAAAMSTNDEREQTLNQLLVEMDGFDSTTGVILLAATNRPEILDQALLRPGRFDRQVLVDKPDLLGREEILRIHSKGVKLDGSVLLKDVAKATPGFVGADLANIVNEAALLAVRAGRKIVLQCDFDEAIEKSVAGLEKKNRLINPREREIVAYHETGHALVAAFTPDQNPVQKISIVPRGFGALGYTMQTPTEDRFLMTQDELIGEVDVLLGGRAAESIIYNKLSTGASNDIERATKIVRNMITVYGMSERFKNVALSVQQNSYLQGGGSTKEYSETTQQYIDDEISRILAERYEHVIMLLKGHTQLLETLTERLMHDEVLTSGEFMDIVKANEQGFASYSAREDLDMKPSERAAITGKKRNEEILARNKAAMEAKKNRPPEVDKEHKTDKPFVKEVELKLKLKDPSDKKDKK
ncbi:MAG: cell division protein FtsH [Spirochaetaceae bacterium 4572_7]|nr:MAG: cell division protein FtsH [Spirochaetaceae bacterium 4572_7]